jgi:hypothetical protein
MRCGECTVCCTVCDISELNSKPGDRCINCDGSNCIDYDNRPQTCREFECAYYQGGNNIKLRPDKCGVMFFKKNERIFCGAKVPGKPMTDLARGQIKSFNQQGYSVVMLEIGETPHIILSNTHEHEDIYTEYIGILKNGNL